MDGPRPDAATTVPPAWPPGLDFFRLLLLLGEATVILSIGTYLAADVSSLADDPVWLALASAGLVGAAIITSSKAARAYLVSCILISAFPMFGMLGVMRLHLLDPLGGRTFIGAAFALLGLLVSIPAAIRGYKRARHGEHTPIARGWRSRHGTFVIASASLVLGAIYAGGIASIAAHVPVGGTADFAPEEVGADTRLLVMRDFKFQPPEFNVSALRLTGLTIENDDAELHTFTYQKDGTAYNHNVPPGTNTTVWLHFPEPGIVRFRCLPHSDGYDDVEDMVGTIRVVGPT